MALPKYVNTGTASVTNGATAVTGTGTAWANLVKADDVFRVGGYSVRIASVTDNTHLTLAEGWPGTSLTDDPYEIAITYDGPEFQLRVRQLLEELGILNGATVTFQSIADAAAYSPVAAPDSIRTAGYTTAGDGGGALYKAVVSEPSHEGKFSITLAGGTTAWFELAEGVPNVKMFGAIGDGSTNDATALNAAFAAGWATIAIPEGDFKYGSALTVAASTEVIGVGPQSLLQGSFATGDCITLGVNADLSRVKLYHSATRTSGATVVMGSGARFHDFEMTGWYVGIKMAGASVGSPIIGPRVFNGQGYTPSTTSGGSAIFIDRYSSPFLAELLFSGVVGGTQPDVGIYVGSGDTIVATGVHFLGFKVNLQVNPQASETAFTASWSNCVWDSSEDATKGCIQLCPANASASIKNWTFDNCWTGTSSGVGLWIEAFGASATVDSVQWNNGRVLNTALDGILVAAGAKNIIINGNQIGNCDTKGIRVAGNATDVVILGNRIGNLAGLGACDYGIVVEGTSDYVDAEQNNVRGNTTAGISHTSSGTHNRLIGNIGFNDTVSAAAITIGSSGTVHTAGERPETLYFTGGTGIGIIQGGRTILAATPATVQLQPHESAQVFYSTTPTGERVKH